MMLYVQPLTCAFVLACAIIAAFDWIVEGIVR
jgi:hypothetical protein